MHRHVVFIWDVWKPGSIEIMDFHLWFKFDVIIRATSIFVNMKIDKFNEILFVHKFLNINQLKTKQTYIERLSFHCALYLWLNGSRYEGTPSVHCRTAPEKAVSWVDACASGAPSWSKPNDILFSSSLLEELAMIMCSLRAIDFPLCIYTNLMNIWINNFDLRKKNSNTSSTWETTQNFQSCK